jgi:type II secretory pathway component PulJ
VNPFEMVVVIVFLSIVASMVASMYSSWLKHRRKGNTPADDARLARLEERIKVLERIVTDSGYDLRRQFRDLERDA